ncbi:hypothetical protein HRbin02_01832 [Candidatus Calditenuaceae archaeon HR02]|nr:hypothetical protein HRbin02_01832 [Candidatus Calditenuaceae archaeon HR02]
MYATSTEPYYLLDSGEWRKYMDSDPEARLGFLRGFFDGDGAGLMPAYANTDVQLLEYIRQLLAELDIRTSPLILAIKKGSKAWHPKRRMWIERKNDVYVTYIYPEDHQRFLEKVGTSIPRRRYLIDFSIKRTRRYMDKIGERKEWWKICEILKKSIGRNMMKCRRTPAPPPLFPLLIIII